MIHNRYTITNIDWHETGDFDYDVDYNPQVHSGQVHQSSKEGFLTFEFHSGPLAGNAIRLPVADIVREVNEYPDGR